MNLPVLLTPRRKAIVWLLAFAVVIFLSVTTVYQTSQYLLDSDSASELVLSKHLHDTGRILSPDWFYSTEIRVLYTPLIFAPLFGVFQSWHMVRFVGTLLLHFLYLASYGFLTKQAGMNRKAFVIGGSLLLLPVSVSYGRIVLYQVSYIVYITISFTLTGLLLALMKQLEKGAFHKRPAFWGFLISFLLLSFLSALNGYRQIAITQAPLALMTFVWMFKARSRRSQKRVLHMLLLLGSSTAMGLIGLLVNHHWHAIYHFADYSSTKLRVISPNRMADLLFGVSHQFGYRRDLSMMTKTGVLSMLGVVVGLACITYSLRSLVRSSADEKDASDGKAEEETGSLLIRQMLLCSLGLVTLIFFLTGQNSFSELYYLPYSVWFIPLLAFWATHSDDGEALSPLPGMRQLAVYILCGICVLNGLANLRSFQNPTAFGQTYEGLDDKNPHLVADLEQTKTYLLQEGYDLGYSTHWNANILTEMSDGLLKFSTFYYDAGDQRVWKHDWLTLKENRSCVAQKPFLLLRDDELGLIREMGAEGLVQEVSCDNGYHIYQILDLEAWRSLPMWG